MNPQQPQPQTPPDPNAPQPVAYDSEGRPLYAAPPPQPVQQAPQQQPQVVHISRSTTPVERQISPEVQARHKESLRLYPGLNLSDGEYIISAVRRHPIGLIGPMLLTLLLVSLSASVIFSYPFIAATAVVELPPYEIVSIVAILLILLFGVGGYIYMYIYQNNRFFLTNESVIQEIQTSLFARREQTVSLANIEDASFRQHGLLQSMFNYGSIRLSTEGDETTYRFYYVSEPKLQIATLNNAVEAFKNGHPIDDN